MASHEQTRDLVSNKSEHKPGSPFVTVIVPVFNDKTSLLNCLAGLKEQIYPADRLEIIVVDNGSTSALGPPEYYPLTVRIVCCEKPGSYAARNAGARTAIGNIFAFTDADCIPDPEWLSKGVATLLAANGKSIIGGQVLFSQPTVRSGTALYQQAIGFQQAENIRHKGFTATANMFCTAEQFGAVGAFNEQLLSGGDREWCWRAARQGISVDFAPDTIVQTMPRIRLRDAVRQARRVSAGRAYLGNHDSSRPEALARYRTLIQSIMWIISMSHVSKWERIKILTAGATIRLSSDIESVKLRFGGAAERR
jgi:glycosyltransferase involved in cell wall biosynthesis